MKIATSKLQPSTVHIAHTGLRGQLTGAPLYHNPAHPLKNQIQFQNTVRIQYIQYSSYVSGLQKYCRLEGCFECVGDYDICIYAPEGCQHGTHANGTAYTRGTYSRDNSPRRGGTVWKNRYPDESINWCHDRRSPQHHSSSVEMLCSKVCFRVTRAIARRQRAWKTSG